MRYAVRHLTRFRYAAPVRFARCNLRLAPIAWDGQIVEASHIEVTPAASLTPARNGGYLANVQRMVMDRPARELSIESRVRLSVTRPTPVAESGDPAVAVIGGAALDVRGLGATSPASYLFPSPLIELYPEIAAWCALELQPGRGVVEAGLALARAIQAGFRYDGSATEVDTSPADAFAKRHGVCQDFAQIMIAGARAAGLPAAYVSGYLRTVPPSGRERLIGADATHAWVLLWSGEARGWLGFDPTNGCMVGEDHIVAAIGRDYGDVAPIDGVFLGRDGQDIEVAVDVEPLS